MSWNLDDPRWTAYLLGELSPQERAEAEACLRDDPELRARVAEWKDTLSLLETALRATPAPALDELRREAVLREKPRRRRPAPWLAGIAAALLALLFGYPHLAPRRHSTAEPAIFNESGMEPLEESPALSAAPPAPTIVLTAPPAESAPPRRRMREVTFGDEPMGDMASPPPLMTSSARTVRTADAKLARDSDIERLEAQASNEPDRMEALPTATPTPTPTPAP